jgi:undecaprenyl-diphosphatase
MLNSLIQFHKDTFLLLHSLVLNNLEMQKIIFIIAKKIDYYVIGLAFIVLVYFVYQSIEETSFKRFVYLAKEGLKIFISVCVSWLISYLIKIATHLPRPFLRFPNEVNQLFDYGGFDSFPSGHATLFMALGVMIYLHHKKTGYFFIFLAVIISLARVIAGIHFPIDILVGWFIGGFVSLFIYKRIIF